ncbi:hypothetical protein C8R47DRAFT_1222022 [Mycena vitilis]|nr:hypothetical protein C8R47DRAFT_1222022 [Mycena vitilis]
MQCKILIALIVSCLTLSVAAAPTPVPIADAVENVARTPTPAPVEDVAFIAAPDHLPKILAAQSRAHYPLFRLRVPLSPSTRTIHHTYPPIISLSLTHDALETLTRAVNVSLLRYRFSHFALTFLLPGFFWLRTRWDMHLAGACRRTLLLSTPQSIKIPAYLKAGTRHR